MIHADVDLAIVCYLGRIKMSEIRYSQELQTGRWGSFAVTKSSSPSMTSLQQKIPISQSEALDYTEFR